MKCLAKLQMTALISFLMLQGCATPFRMSSRHSWVTDYDTVEHRLRASDRDAIIFYIDDLSGRNGIMDDLLKDPAIQDLGETHICCTLVKSFEPDRRFVAQYGVERAPALIRIHRDGTYHATTQVLGSDDILQFVEQSLPPGAQPNRNPLIPRYARYEWVDSLEDGRALSKQIRQPMFILYYRGWTGDWDQMIELLAPHEVYSRLAPLIHVRQRRLRILGNQMESPFGELQLPALVVVGPDDTAHTLQQPTASDAIARFVDGALRSMTDKSDPSAPVADMTR